MRINDILNETVNEAVSVTQYEDIVEQAIRSGISQSMIELAGQKGQFSQEENELATSARSSPLHNKFNQIFTTFLESKISTQLRVKISREIGMPVPTAVSFETTPANTKGFADGTEILLTNRYSKKLSSLIIENLFNSVISSYSEDELLDSLYFTCKMYASGDKQIVYVVNKGTETLIDNIVSTVLHELVHVIQHHRQASRPSTEYRSYLDKKKGEFSALHDKADSGNLSDPEKARYYHLYLASPQEMAAFSHEMAMYIIRGYDLNRIQNVKDIPKFSEEDIVDAVKSFVHDRFRDPKNAKEYTVFKRYIKLVYQELDRYVDLLRKRLEQKKKSSP
jgi:hypothetical protein